MCELYLNKAVCQKAGGVNNYLDLDLFESIITYFATQMKFTRKLLLVLLFFDNMIPIFQTIFKGFLHLLFEENLRKLQRATSFFKSYVKDGKSKVIQ